MTCVIGWLILNIEVEVKVKISDKAKAKEILQKVGSHVKTVRQVDTYFVPSHRDFFEKLPAKEFFRIRVQPDNSQIAYHKVCSQGEKSEHSEEYEVKIDEVERMFSILEHLNFKKSCVIDKTREYYNCGEFEVVLDEVVGLGTFIEVEVISSTKEVAITKDDCLKFLDDNNIEYGETYITSSYPELMIEHERQI